MSFPYTRAADGETAFTQAVSNVFCMFTLPRREYHSRNETGFFDITGKSVFRNLFLNQLSLSIQHILREHFNDTDEMQRHIDRTLTGYSGDSREFSITFYYESFRRPQAVKLTDDFGEPDQVATFNRTADEPLFGEPDLKQFDWLYGTYSMGRTDIYGDVSYSLTLSVEHTSEYIQFGVSSTDYDSSVREWLPEEPRWWSPRNLGQTLTTSFL